jgi:hypothetical protein
MGIKARKIPTKVQRVLDLRANVSKADDLLNKPPDNGHNFSTFHELSEAYNQLHEEHSRLISLLQ